jgi:hypothetical protein
LQLAAATLRKTLRASDFAFRIGGDEFALLLPQTDSEQANTLCRRVRAQYEGDIHSLKLDPGVTLDFGIAVQPMDGEQKSELMGTADERLYQLKNAGRITSRMTPLDSRPSGGEESGHQPSSKPERSFKSQETTAKETTPKVQSEHAFPSRGDFAPSADSASPEEPAQPKREDRAVESQPPEPERSVPQMAKTIPISAPSSRDEKRKWERVSLAGTKAYAMLSEADKGTATLIDLSYGGVALLLEKGAELPKQFSAILHVPILPPVRVILRQAYTQRLDGGRMRAGCSFVS